MSRELIEGAVAGQLAASHALDGVNRTTQGDVLWRHAQALVPGLPPVESTRLKSFLRVVEKRLESLHAADA